MAGFDSPQWFKHKHTNFMKYTLSQAIKVIEKHTGLQLSAIQFEDGSGHKFNYIPAGNNGWRFIDLSIALKN